MVCRRLPCRLRPRGDDGAGEPAVALEGGVYVWSPGHGTPQRITSCSNVCTQGEFAWSPNDRQVAFVSDVNVYAGPAIEVMNADGSDVHTLCDVKRCGSGLAKPMWSPDGHKLVFSNEGALGTELFGGSPPSPIWIANNDGSKLEKLTQPNCNAGDPQPQGCALDTSPAWSPNGRLIAFSHHRIGLRPATSVEIMRADGSHRHSIYRCGGESCNQTLPLAWTPDGKAIASGPITADDPWVHVTTLAGKTTTIRTCAGGHCVRADGLAWSPNGKQLALWVGGNPPTSGAWVIGRDGTGLHRVADGSVVSRGWQTSGLNGAKAKRSSSLEGTSTCPARSSTGRR